MNKSKGIQLLRVLSVIIVIYLQHLQLTYSAAVGISKIFRINIVWQLINFLIVSLFYLFISVLSGNKRLSLIISSCIITLLSISNYFAWQFHGSPFLAGDIYSIEAALNVVSEYQFKPDSFVLRLLMLFILELTVILLVFRQNKEKNRIKRKKAGIIFLLYCIVLWGIFFSPWTLFPDSLYTWSWEAAVKDYGYELVLLNSTYLLNHKLMIPQGYSADQLVKGSRASNQVEKLPDIILILNETLCDLSSYSDVHEGKDVLASLYENPEIIHGFSTSSLVGGGTNNSEYELLTSNSMSGLSISAPFLYFDMNNANSIVSYLKNFDYNTAGMHCGNKSNYGRNTAYRSMGFDEVYLGKESFSFYQKYGNRPWLDEDNYNDMIEVYGKMGNNPRFIYLLTFQNHGGYEQNPPEMDTVSISGDMGEYTDDTNEFLSSISKSADAFIKLTEYFEESERPVIILMVGDHAPAFIKHLPAGQHVKSEEYDIAVRTVPYFVWANYQIDTSVFAQKSSMIDLVPMLLKSMGAPLTDYYQIILDLNESVPVRTYTGIAEDKDGSIFRIAEDEPYYDQIEYYLYMEYNNILKGNDYRKELFELEK